MYTIVGDLHVSFRNWNIKCDQFLNQAGLIGFARLTHNHCLFAVTSLNLLPSDGPLTPLSPPRYNKGLWSLPDADGVLISWFPVSDHLQRNLCPSPKLGPAVEVAVSGTPQGAVVWFLSFLAWHFSFSWLLTECLHLPGFEEQETQRQWAERRRKGHPKGLTCLVPR